MDPNNFWREIRNSTGAPWLIMERKCHKINKYIFLHSDGSKINVDGKQSILTKVHWNTVGGGSSNLFAVSFSTFWHYQCLKGLSCMVLQIFCISQS